MALKNVYILFTTIESHIDGVMQQVFTKEPKKNHNYAVAYREGGGFGGFKPPEIPKTLQNRAKLKPIEKTVKNC